MRIRTPTPNPTANARRRRGPPTSAIARAGGGALSLLRRKPRPVSAAQTSATGEMPPVTPVAAAAVGGATPPIVLGDENRIRQVVANLLGNARRFTAEDSPIELRIGVDADGGHGLDRGRRPRRGHPGADPRQDLPALLARRHVAQPARPAARVSGCRSSRRSSRRCTARSTVDETPGGGATFRVAFPLAQERDAAEHLLIETQPLERLPRPQD